MQINWDTIKWSLDWSGVVLTTPLLLLMGCTQLPFVAHTGIYKGLQNVDNVEVFSAIRVITTNVHIIQLTPGNITFTLLANGKKLIEESVFGANHKKP